VIKPALVLLLGLVLVQPGAAARAGPKYLPFAMRFVDPEHGYVVLEPQTSCASCRNRVERTSDGGRSWLLTSMRHMPFPPAERSFRATWRNGSRRDLRLASVVGPKVAWATWQRETGDSSRLFISRDGGLAWRRVRLPCGRPYSFWRPLVAATSAVHAWVLCLGEPGVGQQNKALYETTDGKSWVLVLRKNLSGSGYGQSLAFSPTGFGLLAESRGGLLVTRNGGRSWRWADRITSPEEAEPQSISLFPPSYGLVLVRDDRAHRQIELFRTRDSGRTWRLLHVWR
jgi:photosystem II stability/assembly factor-like uncharacterized protein